MFKNGSGRVAVVVLAMVVAAGLAWGQQVSVKVTINGQEIEVTGDGTAPADAADAAAAQSAPASAPVGPPAKPAANAAEIAKLVEQLGSDPFKLREEAQRRLIATGGSAEAALAKAAQSSDAEVAERAKKALEAVRAQGARAAAEAALEQVAWEHPLDQVVNGLLPAGDAIVCATGGGTLMGLDAATGKERWKDVALAPTARCVQDGIIYMAGKIEGKANRLGALEAATGKVLWSTYLPAGTDNAVAMPTMTVSDGHIYFAWLGAGPGGEKVLPLFDRKGGAQHMALKLSVLSCKDGAAVRQLDLEWPLAAPPVAAGELLVLAGENHVRAGNAETGKAAWTVDAAAVAPPLVKDGAVYILTGPDKLQASALDLKTGKKLWERATEAAIPSRYGLFMPAGVAGLAATDDALLLTGWQSLTALARKDGRVLWSRPLSAAPLPAEYTAFVRAQALGQLPQAACAADGVAYVGSAEGLHAVDLADGHELWRLRVQGGMGAAPQVAGPLVLFGSGKAAGGADGIFRNAAPGVVIQGRVIVGGAGGGQIVINNNRVIVNGQEVEPDKPKPADPLVKPSGIYALRRAAATTQPAAPK